MEKNKIRSQILESFLYNLRIISDKSYQKRIWVRAEGPEANSFDDAVCDFFDLGEYIFDNYEGYGVTKEQQKILNKFRDEFELFSDEHDWPPEFIDTPEWDHIVNLAKEVLEAFHYEHQKPS